MTEMTSAQLVQQEWSQSGTSPTNNEQFNRDGYLVVKKLCDPTILFNPLPNEKGQYTWWGKKLDQFVYNETENQVEGSLSRYNHPQYKKVHTDIRLILEELIGNKLYNTYYYDRYYFQGQELKRHADRHSCEISVTVHIGTNIDEDWPIWIKTPDVYEDENKTKLVSTGENRSVILEPGDGMIYKGCERPHWRDPMPGSLISALAQLNGNPMNELYYHQIFFHYVLQDGSRAHHAWDMAK